MSLNTGKRVEKHLQAKDVNYFDDNNDDNGLDLTFINFAEVISDVLGIIALGFILFILFMELLPHRVWQIN